MTLSLDRGNLPVQPELASPAKPSWFRRGRLWVAGGLLLLVICLALGGVTIWAQHSNYRTLGQHRESVDAVDFSPDGKSLYSGCRDKNNPETAGKVWAVATGSELGPFPRSVGTLGRQFYAFSPDGKTLASCGGEGSVQLSESANSRELAVLPTPKAERVEHVTFSPDARYLAGLTRDNLLVWKLATRELVATLPFDGNSLSICVTFSPDGRFLAEGGYLYYASGWTRNRVVVWKTGTWQQHCEIHGPVVFDSKRGDFVFSLAFSPDGSKLALGTMLGNVGLVDVGP